MNLPMILFAVDFGDIVKVLIPVVVALLWLINRLKNLVADQRPAGHPPPSPRPPVPQLAMADEPEEADMNDEVSDFLRRAAQRRGAAERPEGRPPIGPPQPAVGEELVDVEIVDDGPLGGSVNHHVEQHLGAEEFVERSSQLGQRVATADDVMDSRMHHKFDHQLGSLEKEDIIEDVAPIADGGPSAQVGRGVALGEIAALMGDPESLRAAIVFAEIIQRPEHRW